MKNYRPGLAVGVKAGDMLSEKPPKLAGEDDFVLKDIKEREFRVRILVSLCLDDLVISYLILILVAWL